MRILFIAIITQILLTSCSTLATGGAEVTGLALWHDRRTSQALAEDERIEIAAALELNSRNDMRSKCHFNVTAYNGVVLVTGETPTEQLRNKAISTVRVISGIKLVYNELTIAQPSSFATRSYDTLITAKIKSALTNVKDIPGFDATRIKVITESGVVFLLGLVHKSEAQVATEIARREHGVKRVVKLFEYI